MPSRTGSTGNYGPARRAVRRRDPSTAMTNDCTSVNNNNISAGSCGRGKNRIMRSSSSSSSNSTMNSTRSLLRPASTSIAAALVVSMGAAAAASFSPSTTAAAATSPAFCLPPAARVPGCCVYRRSDDGALREGQQHQQQFRRRSSLASQAAQVRGMGPTADVAGGTVSSLRCSSSRAAGGWSWEGVSTGGGGGGGGRGSAATRRCEMRLSSAAVEHADGQTAGVVPAGLFATATAAGGGGAGRKVRGVAGAARSGRRKGVERSRGAAAAAGLSDGVGASKMRGDPLATMQLQGRSCEDSVYFGDVRGGSAGERHQRERLLTHDEEMELGARVQRYRRLLEDKEKLEASLGRPVELAEAVAASGLSRKRYNGVMVDGMAARQRLVVSNLALVVSLASKYKRSNLERCMETLIQEGTLGLIQASERYNPARGFRFATYAVWWIEAKLRLAIQTQERLIYVPMWVKDKYRVISRSLASLREALGREPTSKELADQVLVDTDSKVKVTPERVENIKTWMNVQSSQVSLDNGLRFSTESADSSFSRESSMAANEPSLEVTSDSEILRSFLESCMAQDLTCVQQKIVRMRVGLGGRKRNTRKEISRVLNMPVDTVAGEERKAFNKLGILRGHAEAPLRDFRDLR